MKTGQETKRLPGLEMKTWVGMLRVRAERPARAATEANSGRTRLEEAPALPGDELAPRRFTLQSQNSREPWKWFYFGSPSAEGREVYCTFSELGAATWKVPASLCGGRPRSRALPSLAEARDGEGSPRFRLLCVVVSLGPSEESRAAWGAVPPSPLGSGRHHLNFQGHCRCPATTPSVPHPGSSALCLVSRKT